MNQGGLKSVVTEPTRLENKRERRRGAAGRAAALRRAPSDSDCSGETASLSADSGDRAPRPPPLPTRAGKNRSRRRGSEWEVLEGLKDGQRFDKRPDVFNGYLHKKRKWPLKGWHKRFFVVDGGILVYARSPTDVARGRLHGSVDVGLSVISAKARRRRIDIDADEFIYHLRAKTPEVFRTWLNVLKAHRLYRQHLLTFGARESVPKIHAPLEDLPPTDTSSRTSHDSQSSTLSSSEDFPFPSKKELSAHDHDICDDSFCFCHSTFYPPDEHQVSKPPSIDPRVFDQPLNERIYHNHSLCSMNCVARFTLEELKRRKSPDFSVGSTDAEKQIHSTDLDINSLRNMDPIKENDIRQNREFSPNWQSKTRLPEKRPLFFENKVQPTTAYFFFTRNKSRTLSPDSPMKRSKKSTNLVKYRNFMNEPTLKRPLSKCMLLGKYKVKVSKQLDTDRGHRAVACDSIPKESNEVQVTIIDDKSDPLTTSDYDNITERLMVSIFQNPRNTPASEMKYYIKQVIKDLYDVKFQEVHPVKALFRSLLEYWLKNTTVEPIKTAMRHSRSIDRQSNRYFTKDQNLSSVYISNVTKETQFHGLSELLVQYKKKPNTSSRPASKPPQAEKRPPPKCPSPRRDTESFEKERRIQELERLLKNTVYMCETTRSDPSKDKDIKITKTLIDNLGKWSHKSNFENSAEFKNDNSNSSTEQIQDTINHLISETSIPPDVAKEFLSAYLDVLLKDDSKSLTNTSSQSSDQSAASKPSKDFACGVQTEAVVKRISRSVTTLKTEDEKEKPNDVAKPVDPGQLYLKDILDKITTIFSRVKKMDEETNDMKVGDCKHHQVQKEQKDELGRTVKEYPGKNLIYENFDENSVVIDLSKYDLEHISMFSDPTIKGIMSITIKLREKPPNIGESNRTHLSLQFADAQRIEAAKQDNLTKDNWLKYLQPADTNSNEMFQKKPKNVPKPFIDFPKEFDLKPYLSSSDATSKAYKVTHESEHSLDLSFKSSNSFRNDSDTRQSFENEGTQSCYIMSFKKESLNAKFQSKKKVRLKECNGILLSPKGATSSQSNNQPELSIFEKPAPRVIDEKFILLLLENLSLLSKNIPSLYKDINSLFIKLRKKHEKMLKTCGNIQGLSLLGKIYNEESCGTSNRDATTQWDYLACGISDTEIPIKETAVNTSSGKIKLNVQDAYISAIDLKLVMNSEVQTFQHSEEVLMTIECPPPSLGDTSLVTNMAQTDSITSMLLTELDRATMEHSTSNPNWFRKINTKECSMSTMIKCVLDSEAQNFQTPRPKDRDMVKKKKQSPKVRQDLIKEISLLSPSFKVSTQSQTDRKLIRYIREKRLEKDFKVYQLYLSKKYELARSNSATDSNVEVNPSDDMKTLYRCSSDPSYCSGLLSPTGGPIRGPQAGFVSGTPGGRLSGWIIESGGPLDNASRELGQAQLSVQQLQRLLDALELQQQMHHDTDVRVI